MANTDVDVCNLAIGLGGGEPIAAMDEDTPLGEFSAKNYPHLRETCLAAYRWVFAKAIGRLQQLVTPADPVMPYCFAMPADVVGSVYAWRDGPDPRAANRVETLVVAGANPTDPVRVWSRSSVVWAEYTRRTGEGAWPPWFTDLVVNAFAEGVALKMMNRGLASDFRVKAWGNPQDGGRGGLFGAAMNQDAIEAPPRQLAYGAPGDLVDVRRVNGGFCWPGPLTFRDPA